MKAILCAALAAATLAVSAHANTPGGTRHLLEKYASVGRWHVFIDPTVASGCSVEQMFRFGDAFRLGLDMRGTSGGYYLLFGNSNWRSIKYGKSYEVEVQCGQRSPWIGVATGYADVDSEPTGLLFLYVSDDAGSSILGDFMQEKVVSVRYQEKEILRLDLKGSHQAGMKLIECQKAANERRKDPFSAPKR